jgi:hypothetical protein
VSLFLLGAGFDIDATREAGVIYGHSMYRGTFRMECGYPLMLDVLRLCFGLNELPAGKSVEDLFADAEQAGDYEPMQALIERLMEADYYIAQKLASESNSYVQFFERFTGSVYLTFNYDSLPEIILSRKNRWQPEDGYGVPVEAERMAGTTPVSVGSDSLVVHLHGTACVYPTDFTIVGNPIGGMAELVRRPKTLYSFDPESIGHCFPFYRRAMSRTGLVNVEERVIAPVPNKSEGLKAHFIRESYAKALPLVHQAGTLVAVGYSFSPYDRVSYGHILQALAQSENRTLVLVSPQAGEVAQRISIEFPTLRVRPIEKTFSAWAAESFQGTD